MAITTHQVNLDALIRREDFEAKEGEQPQNRRLADQIKIDLTHRDRVTPARIAASSMIRRSKSVTRTITADAFALFFGSGGRPMRFFFMPIF